MELELALAIYGSCIWTFNQLWLEDEVRLAMAAYTFFLSLLTEQYNITVTYNAFTLY